MATRPKPIWSLNAMPETPKNAATPTDAVAATTDQAPEAAATTEATNATSQAPEAAQAETATEPAAPAPPKSEFPEPVTENELLMDDEEMGAIKPADVQQACLTLGHACNVPHETMRTRLLEIGGYSLLKVRALILDAVAGKRDSTQLKHDYADVQEFCKVKRNEIKAMRKPAEAAAPTE